MACVLAPDDEGGGVAGVVARLGLRVRGMRPVDVSAPVPKLSGSMLIGWDDVCGVFVAAMVASE